MDCRWQGSTHSKPIRNFINERLERRLQGGRRYSRYDDAAPLYKADNVVPLHPQVGPQILTRCATEIEPEPIGWIWDGCVARGKLTVIGGDPEEGKSQLGVYIAAMISKGGSWPNNEGRAPLGSVIILSAEDGAEDTLVPRLIAAGADRRKIHLL
jgi:putative DNA primase/helicase